MKNEYFQNKTVTQSQQIPTSERNVNTGESTNPGENNVERPEGPQDENAIPSIREIHNVFVDVLNVLRREIGGYAISNDYIFNVFFANM